MATTVRAIVALTFPLLCAAPAFAQGDLEKARTAYNAGQLDDSITFAAMAKSKPAAVPSATLITARARLERFRRTNDPKDLAAARTDLASLDPRNLAPQEVIEWQIGLGTALFLDGQPGPASEMFSTALPGARERLTPDEYDKLLEWWGSTLSRVAETHTSAARKDAYAAMLPAVRGELDRNPFSRPATYWSVVAARGAGDLEGAWNAAIAGWIRAGHEPEGTQFRTDLDRLITQTLIPERAQARTGQRLDARATQAEIATLTEQWRAIADLWRPLSP
jgi:hypothetical protein